MKLTVTVNGTAYDVEVDVEQEAAPSLATFHLPSIGIPTAAAAPARAAAPAAGGGNALRAAIAGTVTQVKVAAGDEVKAGDVVVVLEAMKMETEVTAPADGKVAAVPVSAGQAVAGGDVLVEWA